jgi:formate dehydrogenase major subunit
MECIVVQDLFLNETRNSRTCSCRARRSSKRTARSPTPSDDLAGRKVMQPAAGYADWEITQLLANALVTR